MKKIASVLRALLCGLMLLSALAFTAVALWQLFSQDWKLFENVYLALGQVLAKLLLSLFCFTLSLRALIRGNSPCFWEGIFLLGITLAAAPFVSNQLGWLLALPSAGFLLLELGIRGIPGRQKK